MPIRPENRELGPLAGQAAAGAAGAVVIREEQHIPPAKHLRKARARLERLANTGIEPADLAQGRKLLPPIGDRAEYAHTLELVLTDYERLLDGLLPPEGPGK